VAKLFLFFILIWPAHAIAQMGSLFGVGPKFSGMGGVSLVQGDSSPYQVHGAPAGLGFLRSVEVGVGGVYFDPRLRSFGTLVLNSNGTQGEFSSAGVLPGAAQVLGMAFPIGKTRPVTFGGVVFLPASALIRVSGSPVNYPFYPLYNDISRNFFFVIGAGYEIVDGFAIGVNLRSTTKSNTTYVLRADNTINYSANATEAKSQSRLSFSAIYDHGRINPGRPFSVGAMYRARAGLETRLSADITAFVPVQGELVSQPAYSPAEWVLQGSVRVGRATTMAAEGAWVKWSPYVSPYGSGNVNSYVIGTRQQAAGFKDIPVARVGIDQKFALEGGALREVSARAGYLYHPSPVPDQTGDSNFADNTRHLFSVGWGLGWRNPWNEADLLTVDLFAQYNWLKERQVRKVTATKVGSPGYTTGGRIMVYGAGATLRF
jgi:long-subunit fatty acid transport protein